jgi:hypothetical protein
MVVILSRRRRIPSQLGLRFFLPAVVRMTALYTNNEKYFSEWMSQRLVLAISGRSEFSSSPSAGGASAVR